MSWKMLQNTVELIGTRDCGDNHQQQHHYMYNFVMQKILIRAALKWWHNSSIQSCCMMGERAFTSGRGEETSFSYSVWVIMVILHIPAYKKTRLNTCGEGPWLVQCNPLQKRSQRTGYWDACGNLFCFISVNNCFRLSNSMTPAIVKLTSYENLIKMMSFFTSGHLVIGKKENRLTPRLPLNSRDAVYHVKHMPDRT